MTWYIPVIVQHARFILSLFPLRHRKKTRGRDDYLSIFFKTCAKKSRCIKISASNDHGYTLIEVIVALAVFAIVATISASVMLNAFKTRDRLTEEANRINTLQLATTLIRRDIEQIIERAVRGTEMHLFPPFVGEDNYTEFTRAGFVNPDATVLSSTLKRVALLCRSKQLVRRTWESLDSPTHRDYHDRVLLDHLEACSFAYVARNRDILNEWRPYAVQQNQNKESLPSAIQLTLSLPHWGNMTLLFIIPEALYGA